MTPRPCSSSLLAFPSAGIRRREHHCEDKVFLYLNKSVHRTGWYEQRRPGRHRHAVSLELCPSNSNYSFPGVTTYTSASLCGIWSSTALTGSTYSPIEIASSRTYAITPPSLSCGSWSASLRQYPQPSRGPSVLTQKYPE